MRQAFVTCDRCKVQVLDTEHASKLWSSQHQEIDLCPVCTDAFHRFMTSADAQTVEVPVASGGTALVAVDKPTGQPIDDPAIAAQVRQVLSGIGNDDDVVEPGGITKGMVRQNPHLYPHIKVG